MTMATIEFEAQRRTLLGKKVKQLRREDRIPGVVYGPLVTETVPVTVDRRQFARFYQTNGHSTLFTLRWEDGQESVFIREVQMHPVRRDALHIDFFAPNLRKPVRAVVPLVFHNPVQTAEGVLTEARTGVEVEALPALIPHQLDVDVSGLERPGDVLRVGDLALPDDVVAITGADEIVAQMESVYVAPEPGEEVEAAEEAAVEVVETETAGGGSDAESE
jgi:large subunit ribosomal protein L25